MRTRANYNSGGTKVDPRHQDKHNPSADSLVHISRILFFHSKNRCELGRTTAGDDDDDEDEDDVFCGCRRCHDARI
eukprot:9732251-Karenia_brevis.AAC.1